MNLDQLVYFTEIVRMGSYNAAAKSLGVSRQALSSYVENLDKKVGRPTLERIDNQLVPTDTGRKYLNTAVSIQEAVTRARSSIEGLGGRQKRTLHIGVTLKAGFDLFNACVLDLLARFPDLQLNISSAGSGDLIRMVHDREIDMALVAEYYPIGADFSCIPLNSGEILLCVPKFHSLGHDITDYDRLPVVDVETLKDEVFILPNKDNGMYRQVEKIYENASYEPTVSMVLSGVETVLLLVKKGYGLAYLPFYEDPEVSYLKVRQSTPLREVIISRRGHIYSEPERYLIFLMYKEMKRLRRSHMEDSEELQKILDEFRED